MRWLRLWWAKRKLAKGLRKMDLTGIKLIISAPREDAPAEQLYLVGQDITACKCGEGDRSVISYFVKTTRWIEVKTGCAIHPDAKSWKCETCYRMTQLDGSPQEHEYRFCPKCGRRITEFVKYKDPFDDYVEGE